MRQAAVRDVRALAVHALGMGAKVVGPTRVEWDCAGGCEAPRCVEVWGRSERNRPSGAWTRLDMVLFGGVTEKGTMLVEMWVPCRRCRVCLKRRSARWAARAHVELAAAPRTWFATFTLSPEARVRFQYRRDLKLLSHGVRPGSLSDDEKFRELASEVGSELTKYFKRVRKESGAPLRYLLVSEAHKDGFPHFHALIHETSAFNPVRHELLTRQWPWGFTRFKLCPSDSKVAYYVCKYLAKSALTRVRASLGYGKIGL